MTKDEIAELLDRKISYQESATSKDVTEITVGQSLESIKSDDLKDRIFNLRSLLDQNREEDYLSQKKKLPAVTYCATFYPQRGKEHLKEYNNLMVIDVDKLDKQKLEETKAVFAKEPYILTFWESPSKEGLKGLIPISHQKLDSDMSIDEKHKTAFRQIVKYFYDSYSIEIDKSGSDFSRLCFLSHDPELVIKDECTIFETEHVPVSSNNSSAKTRKITLELKKSERSRLYHPKNRNKPKHRKLMYSIIKYLSKRNLSLTASYDEWFRVGMALADAFTYDVGLKYFCKLSALDKGKYDEEECKRFLNQLYIDRNGTIGFATILYYAGNKGFDRIIKDSSLESV